jgi:D-alanyl-D-alanine carboxypeptidase/D-alanyl-D-alanine-endopeptidase (penicillin-binding protein 4)
VGALRAALKRGFKKAGPKSGAVVYDLTDHIPLFALRPRVARWPASVEKLYTSVAILRDLGPHMRLQTEVLGTGHLARGGVWRGNLYLRGGGDPTFGDGGFNRMWEHGFGPTATELVHKLRADGIRRVTGELIADGALFDYRRGPPSTHFRPDIPDLGGQLSALIYDHGSTAGKWGPAPFAARELARTMRGAGIEARTTRHTGTAPRSARKLATVDSPSMSVLLRLMDVPSDDLFAEMLTKQLGVRFGGAGTTAAGARVIAKVMSDDYGLQPHIVDGSGLSRADRTSPRQVVALLRALWGTASGSRLYASLPVVGVNGTVQTIAVHTPARGRCVAKTGTLTDVTNLAGYCHSRHAKRLAFALFIDGPSNGRALQLESAMVAAIARL